MKSSHLGVDNPILEMGKMSEEKSEQSKLQRLLRMLMLLIGGRRYSMNELLERFEVSERTLYRTLNTIEQAGFVIDRKDGYRIVKNLTSKSFEQLLYFSEEEAFILQRAIETIDPHYSAKKQLLLKLNTLFDLKALAGKSDKTKIQIINVIREGISKQRSVILKQYRSSNSKTILDRIVEPFALTEDLNTVWCFEKTSKKNKQFRISRITDAQLTGESWQFANFHMLPFTDAFHISADKPLCNVRATLSLKAYNLLIEEFPLAEKYLKEENSQYLLDLPVANFNGVGRFILGLPDEITDIGPDKFRKFIEEKLKSWSLPLVVRESSKI